MSFEGHSTIEMSGATLKSEFAGILDYGNKRNPEISQLPADNRFWMDLDEQARVLNLSTCYFTSSGAKDNAVQILDDNNKITIRDRNPDGSYNKIDGVSEPIVVACFGYSKVKRIDLYGTRFLIDTIKLGEAE